MQIFKSALVYLQEYESKVENDRMEDNRLI